MCHDGPVRNRSGGGSVQLLRAGNRLTRPYGGSRCTRRHGAAIAQTATLSAQGGGLVRGRLPSCVAQDGGCRRNEIGRDLS